MIVAYKIKNNSTGNCACFNCGKYQDGYKQQPFTLWIRRINKKRGENLPMCSCICANNYINKKRGEHKTCNTN